MEPSKDIISVRLARLTRQLVGRSALCVAPGKPQPLHREALLDALQVLYEECNNETLKKGDVYINKFVEKYRPVLTELRQLRVNIADFEVRDIIGRGHFGEVHVVREKQTGDVYAMKTVKKEATLKLKDLAFYEEEREIMAANKSPWLVSLQYAFQDSSQLYLVMEYCPGGDLGGLLVRRGALPEKEAIQYTAEVIMALSALHSMGYVHRDIKPDNLLIDRCGHLKLGDFGSAARIPAGGLVTNSMPVGTPNYIAPELLKGIEDSNKYPHGIACDFWSLGVLMYELVCGQPAFTGKSVAVIYVAILNHKGGVNANTHNALQWPAQTKDNLSAQPTAQYKDVVCRLLNPVPGRRLSHQQLLRHQLFNKVQWNMLREQTPPYVPVIKAEIDSSNFTKPEKQQHTPSVSSLRTRPHFTGRNLPFIGFTYASDVLARLLPSNESGGDTGDNQAEGEKSSDSDGPEGFLNSSFNSTAICLSSFREMEKLLESRKKEIDILHKRVTSAESQQAVGVERAKQVAELEKQRAKLEQQLTDMACHNQKLQRQIKSEHEERRLLETKALEEIKSAKISWQDKHQRQLSALEQQKNDSEQKYRAKVLKLEETVSKLTSKLQTTTEDLGKASKDVETMKNLQKNHKESMAKARRLTRQSFFDPNSSLSLPSTSNGDGLKQQAEKMKAEHKSEMDRLTKEHVTEYKRLQKFVDETRDREQNLRVELEERMKDYSDLQIRCMELPVLQQKVADLEEHRSYLMEKGTQKLAQGKDKYLQLLNERDTLQKRIDNSEFTVCSLETDIMEKDEQAAKLESERGEMAVRLSAANLKEEKYRQKVAELEKLLMKLQEEVTRLETEKSVEMKASRINGDTVMVCTPAASSQKTAFLEERIQTLEKQLKEAHEEGVLLKQEARKANSALWKKEKELSDVDLDKRIATRELKQAEGKLKSIEEEKTKMIERHGNALKDLKTTLSERETEVTRLSQEVTTLTASIDKCDENLRRCQKKVEADKTAYERTTQEFDRSKNDVHRLKAELQYSENRRLKAESVGETYRQEARETAEERRSGREEIQALQEQMKAKEVDIQTLNHNHKLLQDVCNMLEEQLVDFEQVTAVQETRNQDLMEELVSDRLQLETLRTELRNIQSKTAIVNCNVEMEKEKVAQLQKEVHQQRERNLDLEKQLDELLARECSLHSDLEAKCDEQDRTATKLGKLENEMVLMKDHCKALKEEASELRTQLAHVREDALRAQHEFKESQERNDGLRGLIEEMEAQAVHWKQRELKAEATIHQHLKLIDFLQAKVEEASRKKKTFSDMLFGGRSKENLPPSLNATPLRDNKTNRELREQVSELKQKLESFQGSTMTSIDTVDSTPRKNSQVSKNLFDGTFATPIRAPSSTRASVQRDTVKSESNDRPLMEGWVRIEKEGLLHRVYMELRGSRIRWRGDLSSQTDSNKGEISSVQGINLYKELPQTIVKEVLLSNAEQANGLMLKSSTIRLLIVCPSATQRTDWITSFEEAGCVDSSSSCSSGLGDSTTEVTSGGSSSYVANTLSSQTWGRQIVSVDQNKLKYPRCLVEIDEDTLLIGSDAGMFSWLRSRNTITKISSWEHGVHSVTISPQMDSCILLSSPMLSPVCVSLRQLKAVLKALPSTKPHLQPAYIPMSLHSKEQCNVIKLCPTRYLLFVGTSQQLHILKHLSETQSFAPLHRINMQHPNSALLVTPHTLIVAAQTVFEVDLKSFGMEDFLDPSDKTISHAVYGLKKNIYPISILRIKDGTVDGCAEYLICYKEFGIFVDSYGQRSRSEDVLWNNVPLNFVYRKPFLFTFNATCICVMEICDNSFKKGKNGEGDDISELSSSSSLESDVAIVNFKSPNFVGKSSAKGSVYISVTDANKQTQIIELCGGEVFKKNLGVSVETLDTIDDNDSCRNVLISGDTSEIAKAESLLLDTTDSTEIKSDFASSIRQKAKFFNSLHQEKQKVTTIQNLLAGKRDNFESDESDTSSSCSERNVIVHHPKHHTNSASSDSSKKVRFNR